MGFGILISFFVLTLFFGPLFSQKPNTDESFVSDFLQKMGLDPSKQDRSSGSFCSWKTGSCDSKGENVLKLHLSGLGLTGAIPENTIGKLTKLESLDLSSNKITALPSDFWSLGSLINLNLSHNDIVGNLSSNLGNFGKLQALDLSFNSLFGNIPEAVSSLASLRSLNLSHNGFESLVPLGLLQCRSLVSIDLSENKLNGHLPKGFGAAFPRLMFLNLARNQISGWDPDFSELRLIYLNISGNLFQGSAVGFFRWPLQVIDLSRNRFQGHIAEVSFDSSFNWSDLIHLDLSENKLSGGEFFAGLGSAENLKYLNLAFNRFSRQHFVRVVTLTALEYLNLSSTNLIGRIPSNISRLSRLSTLDLSKNHLSEHIPPLSIKKLRVLDLSCNNLTGEIPLALLVELNGMKNFNFSYNNLSFCGSKFSNETLQSSFLGSVNSCPIAANPTFFKRNTPNHRSLKLALSLSFSMIFLLFGLLFLAFRCRTRTQTWAVKQNSYEEKQTVSGPFSFHTDSTTWVADVKQATSVPVIIFEKPLLNFTFADLLVATSHFDRGTLLAEGRFGPVYGGILPGGFHVAVKVLVHGSTLTDEEAARELEFLGRIKHPNLVPLMGYCLAGEQRIAIYEYMENGNLQNLLRDLPLGLQTTDDWTNDTWEDEENNGIQITGHEVLVMNWRFRHKMALGAARALAFLHHGCSPSIVHRDVKASSVYLDSNMEPRLSDFGLAKVFGNGIEEEIARGSPGYVPPELLDRECGSSSSSPKELTPKSDVYGFGVVLFELITGKRPVSDDYLEEKETSLVNWVRGFMRKNQGSLVIDPKIHGTTGSESQIVEALKIGYLCTAETPSKRPTMQQVVGLLKDLNPVIKQ